MSNFPPTLILRHRKENLKKCSLRGLEGKEGFSFYSYPLTTPLPPLQGYCVLSLEAPPLTAEDAHFGLLLIDATWRYAKRIYDTLPELARLPARSLPKDLTTAYPRYQTDCPLPQQGLASIEALYAAYFLLGRPKEILLDNYYWKETFLKQNEAVFPFSFSK